jgi:hypothetical protein
LCNFLSFKIERSPDGLKIVTAPDLRAHSEIPGDGCEGEWEKDGDVVVRVAPDVSDNIKAELEAFVKKTYRTRQNMANKLIVSYLKQGILPDHFYEHSKLDDRKLRLFACDCAERVLPIFEKDYPNDNRPRRAIEVARLFADGKATDEERNAARAAAGNAARAAARDAARAAARNAARAAARDAARAAARDAARAAAGDAEKKEQAAILLRYIEAK